jgi:uncharacterized protein YcfL
LRDGVRAEIETPRGGLERLVIIALGALVVRVTLVAEGFFYLRVDFFLRGVALAKKISLDPWGLMNNSGVLMAMNVITSLTSSTLELESRIDWLDEDGAVLPSDLSLWHGFTLKPGDTRFLNSQLPFPAAGYKISVRRKQ